MNHSHTWEDFKEKASALNLKVDDTKKYTTYLLEGSEQTKKIRDRSLKNDKFLKENLKERIEKNTIGYSVEEVVKLWNDKESIQEKNQEKEISILVEDWQIEKETENFLYVTIDTALDKEATIKIPARCVDKLENGDYQVFIKIKTDFLILIRKVRKTIKSCMEQLLLKIYNDKVEMSLFILTMSISNSNKFFMSSIS